MSSFYGTIINQLPGYWIVYHIAILLFPKVPTTYPVRSSGILPSADTQCWISGQPFYFESSPLLFDLLCWLILLLVLLLSLFAVLLNQRYGDFSVSKSFPTIILYFLTPINFLQPILPYQLIKYFPYFSTSSFSPLKGSGAIPGSPTGIFLYISVLRSLKGKCS